MVQADETRKADPTTLRTRTNVIWSTIDYAAVPMGMLFATPILIHALGIEKFGVLILATAFVGFSAVFNFGFGDTALKYVSHHVNLGTNCRGAEIVRTIGLLSLVSGVVVGGLFALSAPLIAKLCGLDKLDYAIQTLHTVAIIMPLRMMESVFVSTLRGCLRYDLSGVVTVTTKLGNLGLQVALAVLGYDLPTILMATVVTVLLGNVALFAFSSREIGWLIPAFSRDAFAEIRDFSLWSWLQGISGFVYVNTDRLMVSALLGPAALGVYGVCLQLAQNIHYGLAAIAHSLFPKISMLNAQAQLEGREGALRQLYVSATRVISVSAVLPAAFVAVFAHEVLYVWVGPSLADRGHILLSLLALTYGWNAANSIVPFYTLNGLGRPHVQANISVTTASLVAIGCVILIPIFGIVGAACARIPETLFRFCMRLYISRCVIGSVSVILNLDFVRITIVTVLASYALKALIAGVMGGAVSLVSVLTDIVILFFVFLLWLLLNLMEKSISKVSSL